MGCCVGSEEGWPLGKGEGGVEGEAVAEGAAEGEGVGLTVGAGAGPMVGCCVEVGAPVGAEEGRREGEGEGTMGRQSLDAIAVPLTNTPAGVTYPIAYLIVGDEMLKYFFFSMKTAAILDKFKSFSLSLVFTLYSLSIFLSLTHSLLCKILISNNKKRFN